jgi:hypothetical protein
VRKIIKVLYNLHLNTFKIYNKIIKELYKMKKITKLNDLRFNITEDMNNMFIEVVMLRQMLKENKLSNKDRKLLEKELTELTTLFVMEFKKNNVEERKLYNELINK